jgi:hypothetical protein
MFLEGGDIGRCLWKQNLLTINIKKNCAAQPVEPMYIATKSVRLYRCTWVVFTRLYRWCVVLSSICVKHVQQSLDLTTAWGIRARV